MKTIFIQNHDSILTKKIAESRSESDELYISYPKNTYDSFLKENEKNVKHMHICNDRVKSINFDNIIIDMKFSEQEKLLDSIEKIDSNNEFIGLSKIWIETVICLTELLTEIINNNILRGGGKFFFLLRDDTFGYIDNLNISPVYNNIITSMTKSLAKEYSRFNMIFNSFWIQPELSELNMLKNDKTMLKNFALKYRTINYDHVVKYINIMIENDFPINGATVPLGNGVVSHV